MITFSLQFRKSPAFTAAVGVSTSPKSRWLLELLTKQFAVQHFSASVIYEIPSWILNTLSHKILTFKHQATESIHAPTRTHTTPQINLFTSHRGVCSEKVWSSHWWQQLMCLHSSRWQALTQTNTGLSFKTGNIYFQDLDYKTWYEAMYSE